MTTGPHSITRGRGGGTETETKRDGAEVQGQGFGPKLTLLFST